MPGEPTPRELEILKVLWDDAPAGVRQVHRRLAELGGTQAFNTVQTLLRIMDDKGLVRHEKAGRGFVYWPLLDRDGSAAGWLERVFDGALDQCVASLLRSRPLNPGELDQIERLIADARRREESP